MKKTLCYFFLFSSLLLPEIFPQQITVTSPNGGENWQTATSRDITWTDNIIEKVRIELYKNSNFHSIIKDSTFSDGQFHWDVPLNIPAGNDYRIKIISVDDGNIFDFSDNDFSIFQTELTLLSPNGGENWQTATSHDINWTDNINAKVRIELYKNSNFHSTIKDSTFSDGQFPWNIPLSIPAGNDYKIKIISVADSNVFDFSDNDFSIFQTELTVLSPNGGENWQAGTSRDINWTDNINEQVMIELYKGGNFHSIIDDATFSDGQFNWNISLNIPAGNDYRIKITSVDDSNIFDFSDSDFSIFPTELNVLSPNGGEDWQTGTSRDITWTDNIDEKVRIELYKNGNFNSTIKDSTFSDGQFPWDIPENLDLGADYKIKISSVDDSNIFDFSDNDFSISQFNVTVLSPNGGEIWQVGTSHEITWTDNISAKVRIELYKNSNFHSTIKDSTFSDGLFPWDIPANLDPGADYRIKITSVDNSNILDFSDDNFTIFDTDLIIISPNGGENWQTGTSRDITWADNITEKVRIELYKNSNFHSTIIDSTFSDGLFLWDIPANLDPGTDYKIKITSVDDSNAFDFSDDNFTLFRTEITVTSPNGGENWQTGTSHDITWTDNITEKVRIELYKNSNFHSIIIDSTISDGQFMWDIPANLDPGADYKVNIFSIGDTSIFDFSDSNFSITIVTNVELFSNVLPAEYGLSQNYPNPFNPSSNIEFGLPERSDASLKIYNIAGQEVKIILDNESLPAGRFRYGFNAANLPSGVYFYVLTAISNVSNKSFRETKKMILLK